MVGVFDLGGVDGLNLDTPAVGVTRAPLCPVGPDGAAAGEDDLGIRVGSGLAALYGALGGSGGPEPALAVPEEAERYSGAVLSGTGGGCQD